MKKIVLLLILFTSCKIVIAQEEIDVPFKIVEKVPIYKGCNEKLKNIELKKCMSIGIQNHISKNFNLSIAKKLGIPKGTKIRISVIFKIDTKGKIVNIKARSDYPELEKEAIRTIKSIPKLKKPGYVDNKPVVVPYSIPIVFAVN